ncbi:hypothetical protein PROFUN_00293 [Planoprotostelium fungivorum]|uniref:Uncharacterized protein n=1 Tax=Planoprotostelium fungivorum TaxID=1890364 RepID=A0A2P6NXZ2_9EUKA|nr:hypothetical protein PROFUN_00293 [Planoprotostelium fungivorum]
MQKPARDEQPIQNVEVNSETPEEEEDSSSSSSEDDGLESQGDARSSLIPSSDRTKEELKPTTSRSIETPDESKMRRRIQRDRGSPSLLNEESQRSSIEKVFIGKSVETRFSWIIYVFLILVLIGTVTPFLNLEQDRSSTSKSSKENDYGSLLSSIDNTPGISNTTKERVYFNIRHHVWNKPLSLMMFTHKGKRQAHELASSIGEGLQLTVKIISQNYGVKIGESIAKGRRELFVLEQIQASESHFLTSAINDNDPHVLDKNGAKRSTQRTLVIIIREETDEMMSKLKESEERDELEVYAKQHLLNNGWPHRVPARILHMYVLE